MLWIRAALSMANRKALFTDLDDTLYSWIDFFAPSVRAMVHQLKGITNLNEEMIFESFRKVYQNRQTLEYSFVLQELDLWEKLGWSKEKTLQDVVNPVRGVFRTVRNHHFKLFPGVRETLAWLKTEDIFVCAYTNAPGYHAERRLRSLNIDRYIDCLAYFIDSEIPDDLHLPLDVQKLKNKDKRKSYIKDVKRFTAKKPNPSPLIKLIEEFDINLSKCYLIGDSIEKDVYLAQQAGVKDIWAQYGAINHKPIDIETIRKISTYSDDEMQRNKIIRELVKPAFVVDNFAELKQIIGSRQLSLGF
jgi:phosphoglycolate phosphatase